MALSRKIAAVVFALVVFGTAAVALYLWQLPREPRFEGKALSQWTEEYRTSRNPAAQKAIAAIGTNALPDLVRDLSADQPDLPEQLDRLRRSRSRSPPVYFPTLGGSAHNLDRHRRADAGFQALGTNAAAAVPELIALLADDAAGLRAAGSLTSIGEPAVAPVLELLATTNSIIKRNVLFALRSMPPSDQVFYALLATKDSASSLPDPEVLYIICQYTNRARVLVPLLIDYLSHPQEIVRNRAANHLGKLGSVAEPALPHLLLLMPNEPNPIMVPHAISSAIDSIKAAVERVASADQIAENDPDD